MAHAGIEAVSRGAQKAILCDNSKQAISIIKKNIDKTHTNEKIELYQNTFEQFYEQQNVQEELSQNNISKSKKDIYNNPKYLIDRFKNKYYLFSSKCIK